MCEYCTGPEWLVNAQDWEIELRGLHTQTAAFRTTKTKF